MEPWRARPVPFWRYGFLPPPRTSARVFTEAVPCRAAASWPTTTWWISGTLTCTSKTASGSSTLPAVSPAGVSTSTDAMSGPLRGGLDEHDGALGPGQGALDEQQPALGVDRVDGEVHRGLADVAHPAGHLDALEHPAGRRAAADRPGRAVLALDTVRRAQAVESVALHDTGEALALGRADDIDGLSGAERLHGQLLADRVGRRVCGAELDEVATRRDAGLLEVAGQRLGHPTRADGTEGDLEGGVAVQVGRPDLGDDARAGLDDSDRDECVVLVPDLGHAELLAEKPLHGGSGGGHRRSFRA